MTNYVCMYVERCHSLGRKIKSKISSNEVGQDTETSTLVGVGEKCLTMILETL